MKGIDVSSHNGNINWSSVKASGIEVVYIKATEGTTYQDPYLNNHYNGAKSVGLPTGFYHFLVGSSSPETQAENFYNNIKGKENNLLPCLDIEHSNNEPSNFMDYALRFIQKFKELSGMNICIYSGPYFINDYLDNRLQCYPLWVAHYKVSTPMSNKVWGNSYVGHQYTETGHVNGVNGNVDLNNFNEGIFLGAPVVANNTTTQQPIDGKIAELQAICGVAVDNVWGPITDNAVRNLPLAGIPYKTQELTKWIQARVGENVDGIFGPATESAVKGWQSSHGLVVDGIAGYNTIRSLALA